jgi:hypothetical protein
MNEESVKIEMRLYALEGIVSSLLTAYCLQAAPLEPLKAFEKAADQMKEAAKKPTFPKADPAMSDLLSAESEAALTRLLAIVHEQITAIPKARQG